MSETIFSFLLIKVRNGSEYFDYYEGMKRLVVIFHHLGDNRGGT